MKITTKLWKSFCSDIKLDRDSIGETYYKELIHWLASNRALIGESLWANYQLDWFASIDLAEYLVSMNEWSPHEDYNHLLKQNPTKINTIVLFVRDRLEELITFKTSVNCDKCDGDDLGVFFDGNANDVVLSCKICGNSKLKSGKKWQGFPVLKPAKKHQLINAGFIK